MKKYIKYLIPIILIFGLTVEECTLYSQTISVNYYQFSNVIRRKELNYEDSKLYVYNQQILSDKKLFVILIPYLKLRDIYSNHVLLILKLRAQLYQKINSFTAQQVLLSKVITSRNPYSSLYIA